MPFPWICLRNERQYASCDRLAEKTDGYPSVFLGRTRNARIFTRAERTPEPGLRKNLCQAVVLETQYYVYGNCAPKILQWQGCSTPAFAGRPG